MAYSQLAFFYDTFMQHAPYDQWVNFTQNIFKRYDKKVQTITDLGCGTGEITLRLASLNYEMTGIDYSPEMLAVADQKMRTLNKSVHWLRQDLRQLSNFGRQDAMISYCDVINYIPQRTDLQNIFKQIYDRLSDKGILIFDVHAINYAQHFLMNEKFAEVTDDLSYIWFCHEGDQRGEMFHELTFFAKNDRGTYERYTEVHQQRTYEETIYEQLLNNCGFRQVDIYYDFQLETMNGGGQPERVFFVALK